MDTLRRNTGHGAYPGSVTTNTCLSGTDSDSRYAERASQRSVRRLQAARYASRSPVRRNSSSGSLRRLSCGRCSRPVDMPNPRGEALPSGRRSRTTIRRPLKCSLTAFSERPHFTANALMYRFTVDTRRFSRGRAFHSATAASASRLSASVQRCHIRGAAPCWFTHDRNVLSTAQIVAWTPPIAAMETINLVVSLMAGLRLQSQFAVRPKTDEFEDIGAAKRVPPFRSGRQGNPAGVTVPRRILTNQSASAAFARRLSSSA